MRIAVTGSRDWNDRALLEAVLARYYIVGSHLHVGDCPSGADEMAWQWAFGRIGQKTRYVADWEALGRRAGPARNREMLDTSYAQLLIAFKWGATSSGTDDCIKAARERHLPVLLIQHTGTEANTSADPDPDTEADACAARIDSQSPSSSPHSCS